MEQLLKFTRKGIPVQVTLPETLEWKETLLGDKWEAACPCQAEKIVFSEDMVDHIVSDTIAEDGKRDSVNTLDAVAEAHEQDLLRQKAEEQKDFMEWAYLTQKGEQTYLGQKANEWNTSLTLFGNLCDRHFDVTVRFTNPLKLLRYVPEEAIKKFSLKDNYATRVKLARYLYVQGFKNVADLKAHIVRLIADLDKVVKFKHDFETTLDSMVKAADFQTSFPNDRLHRVRAGAEDALDEAKNDLERELKRRATEIYRHAFQRVTPPDCAQCSKTTCEGCAIFENPGGESNGTRKT